MVDSKIELSTLTPIWTGDIDHNSAAVHETSIIGSLRWWYRKIVQSNNYPGVCSKDCPEEKSPQEIRTCPVCKIFGFTGQRRRFRLDIEGLQSQPLFFVTHREAAANRNWLPKTWGERQSDPGGKFQYTLNRDVLFSDFSLHILTFTPGDVLTLETIKGLLAFINKFGALGAKTQNGFGQIAIRNEKLTIPDELFPNKERFFSVTFSLPPKNRGRYQNHKDLMIVGNPPEPFNLSDARFIPCAFDLRYKTSSRHPRTGQGNDLGLRPYFQAQWDQETAKQLLGRLDYKEKSKSLIHVSHLYRNINEDYFKFKVFGFIPRNEELPGVLEVRKTIIDFFTGVKMFPRGEPIVDTLYP